MKVKGRWKVACINWPYPDAPHAMSYLLVNGVAILAKYHSTWAEAMSRVNALCSAFPDAAERA